MDIGDVIEDDQWTKLPPLSKKTDVRTGGFNAGVKKGVNQQSNKNLSDHSRQNSQQELKPHKTDDRATNLDNDGVSQLTYPNQYSTSFLPKD